MSIEGTWFAGEAPLTFLFQLKDAHVVGTFHDEKTFTCELKGRWEGNRLTFNFETIWSWLNVHDMGAAVLDLSADGATLSGPVIIGGKPVRWTLTRAKSASRPPPPATPQPQPVQIRPPPSRGGGGGERPLPYRDRILKEVWDSDHDPALLARLRLRAKTEPELDELLRRKGKR